MYHTIVEIEKNTNFEIIDTICWLKNNCLVHNSNKHLTRKYEFIFVFSFKNEDIHTNKKCKSIYRNKKYYENIYNIIEAKNNDGSCSLNKATFSSELVEKLLKIYGKENGLVYDPYSGTGTLGVGCIKFGSNFIGCDIDLQQVEYSNNRIKKIIE